MPNKRAANQRSIISELACRRCEYCQSQEFFAIQPFSTEHIFPRSKGGETTTDNLAFACQGCNGHKYNKVQSHDNVTGKMAALFHPRRQKWSDHFDGVLIFPSDNRYHFNRSSYN